MNALDRYFPAYQKAVSDYETEHPHWRVEVLGSLIKWALKSLKHYVEDVRESEITWDNPFVELHYLVDWNWEAGPDGDIARGGYIFGKITARNTANKDMAIQTLSKMMASQFNATAMADMTNWAWYEKRKDYYLPVLPVELSEALRAIKNKRVRREAFDEIARPFSIGAASVDYEGMEFKDGTPVPKRVSKQLARIGELMDIQSIRFDGEVNGRKIEMGLVFQVHPLIADYDRKKAFHPISVGLFIEPKISGKEIITPTPADWPRVDRETLWTEILQAVDQVVAKLVPKPERQESVILSVNAKLKVPADWWRPENRSDVMKQIADANASAGELMGISVEAAEGSASGGGKNACPVCGWVHDRGFTQIRMDNGAMLSLAGILPDVVRLVHTAHETGLHGLSTKDEELLTACGGYRHPCKAFDDLNQRAAYKLLFDTRRRGFISLHGAVGRNRNKSEASPE